MWKFENRYEFREPQVMEWWNFIFNLTELFYYVSNESSGFYSSHYDISLREEERGREREERGCHYSFQECKTVSAKFVVISENVLNDSKIRNELI